jgi:hypothetical protein
VTEAGRGEHVGELRLARLGAERVAAVLRDRVRGAQRRRGRVVGVTRLTRRTGKKGTATFRLRPRRKGNIAIRVQARGYRTTTVTMPVR